MLLGNTQSGGPSDTSPAVILSTEMHGGHPSRFAKLFQDWLAKEIQLAVLSAPRTSTICKVLPGCQELVIKFGCPRMSDHH